LITAAVGIAAGSRRACPGAGTRATATTGAADCTDTPARVSLTPGSGAPAVGRWSNR
jgi:hypothetical protein